MYNHTPAIEASTKCFTTVQAAVSTSIFSLFLWKKKNEHLEYNILFIICSWYNSHVTPCILDRVKHCVNELTGNRVIFGGEQVVFSLKHMQK